METVDEEITQRALGFIDKAHADGKPFFVWWNSTRMHIWTHLKPSSEGVTGIGIYPDGLVEHDAQVGELLKKLDELGIADNTIVMYSTDNGAETMSWPDGGTTPFRGEKNTNWDGGYRVPCVIRWPGVIKPGTIVNDAAAHEDMLPTLLAAAGDSGVKNALLQGRKIGTTSYKVHLDGYDLLPALQGKAEWPRKEFLYWTDDAKLAAMRFGQWKLNFLEQRAHGLAVWEEPFVELRLPKLFTLRGDPFERADHEAIGYDRWRIDHVFLLVPAQAYVATWLQSFKEFPPRQKPASFSLDRVMEAMMHGPHAN
jgi:arylsulfatase